MALSMTSVLRKGCCGGWDTSQKRLHRCAGDHLSGQAVGSARAPRYFSVNNVNTVTHEKMVFHGRAFVHRWPTSCQWGILDRSHQRILSSAHQQSDPEHPQVVGARLCAEHQSQRAQTSFVIGFFLQGNLLRLVFDPAALRAAVMNAPTI